MRALQTAVGIGINYAEFGTRLRNCAIDIDHTLRTLQDDQSADVREEIEMALTTYQSALEIWGNSITDTGVVMSTLAAIQRTSLPNVIRRAVAYTDRAEAILNGQSPPPLPVESNEEANGCGFVLVMAVILAVVGFVILIAVMVYSSLGKGDAPEGSDSTQTHPAISTPVDTTSSVVSNASPPASSTPLIPKATGSSTTPEPRQIGTDLCWYIPDCLWKVQHANGKIEYVQGGPDGPGTPFKPSKTPAEKPPPPNSAGYWKVIPGKACGPLTIGMSASTAKASMNDLFSDCSLAPGNEMVCTKAKFCDETSPENFGITLTIRDDHVVAIKVLNILNGTFPGKTPQGLGCGSTESDIVSVLGEPDESVPQRSHPDDDDVTARILFYDKLGISFYIASYNEKTSTLMIGERRYWGRGYNLTEN